MWQFQSLFSEVLLSVYIYKKSKKLQKIFKMLSGSSPIFALSNHATFSQTQTGATVPLRAFPSGCRPKPGNFHPFSVKGRVVNIY
jgi:hypothetical protein